MSTSFFALVAEHIQQVEERMRAHPNGNHPDIDLILEHLVSSGGKRVRPAVVLLTGGMLGGDQDRLITLAAAIELLHTATLVHDDLIDGALLRRGIPTLNTQWSSAATVLAGDYVFARSAGLAAATGAVNVMQVFSTTLTTIVSGEIAQLFANRGLANREDYYHRIHAKTASLFEAAAGSAAMISTDDEDIIAAMQGFGYGIGMAFQIVDDVLDFTGDQATVGKPVASDLRQGLITLPAIYYQESHPDNPDLQAVLGGAYHDEELMRRLIASIRSSGAIQQSMDEARGFVRRGIQSAENLPACPEHDALDELAEYFVKREA